jgi:DNA-binding phage protein
MKRHEELKLKLNIVKSWEFKIEKSQLSVQQLAIKAGTTRQTIYNALKEATLPNFSTINKIEEVLNNEIDC